MKANTEGLNPLAVGPVLRALYGTASSAEVRYTAGSALRIEISTSLEPRNVQVPMLRLVQPLLLSA